MLIVTLLQDKMINQANGLTITLVEELFKHRLLGVRYHHLLQLCSVLVPSSSHPVDRAQRLLNICSNVQPGGDSEKAFNECLSVSNDFPLPS